MTHVFSVHPIRPGAADRHRQWCEEIRSRREEFAASRLAVGITGQQCWSQPQYDLAVIRTVGGDPVRSLATLAVETDEFGAWFATREREIHGNVLGEAGVAECLSHYVDRPVDPFDVFVAAAIPLLPDRTDDFCERIARSFASGDGRSRVERWGLTHMAVWLHRVVRSPDRDPFDAVVYELAGDVPGMLRTLATSDDADMHGQRELARECFGLDWSVAPFPLPEPAYAWSANRDD